MQWLHIMCVPFFASVLEHLMPAKGRPTAKGLAQLSSSLRHKKSQFLSTAYTAEHRLRTMLLATETEEPGVEFVKMGSTCQNVHFDKLRRMGLCNLDDINDIINEVDAECTTPRRLTPRMLCFYICMANLVPMPDSDSDDDSDNEPLVNLQHQ